MNTSTTPTWSSNQTKMVFVVRHTNHGQQLISTANFLQEEYKDVQKSNSGCLFQSPSGILGVNSWNVSSEELVELQKHCLCKKSENNYSQNPKRI